MSIQSILENTIKTIFNVDFTWLSGSRYFGYPRPNSDWDFCISLKSSMDVREIKNNFDMFGIPFELMDNLSEHSEYFCDNYTSDNNTNCIYKFNVFNQEINVIVCYNLSKRMNVDNLLLCYAPSLLYNIKHGDKVAFYVNKQQRASAIATIMNGLYAVVPYENDNEVPF